MSCQGSWGNPASLKTWSKLIGCSFGHTVFTRKICRWKTVQWVWHGQTFSMTSFSMGEAWALYVRTLGTHNCTMTAHDVFVPLPNPLFERWCGSPLAGSHGFMRHAWCGHVETLHWPYTLSCGTQYITCKWALPRRHPHESCWRMVLQSCECNLACYFVLHSAWSIFTCMKHIHMHETPHVRNPTCVDMSPQWSNSLGLQVQLSTLPIRQRRVKDCDLLPGRFSCIGPHLVFWV